MCAFNPKAESLIGGYVNLPTFPLHLSASRHANPGSLPGSFSGTWWEEQGDHLASNVGFSAKQTNKLEDISAPCGFLTCPHNAFDTCPITLLA